MHDQFQAFVALFYAIDRLYEKNPCDTTALCAGELDPFLFNSIGSADPAHYIEFCAAYAMRFGEGTASPSECYAFAQEFVASLSDAFHAMYPEDATISDLFASHIDYETWLGLWEAAGHAAAKRQAELKGA